MLGLQWDIGGCGGCKNQWLKARSVTLSPLTLQSLCGKDRVVSGCWFLPDYILGSEKFLNFLVQPLVGCWLVMC